MKHTKQTIILLLAAALACGCGGKSDENKAEASGIAAYVDGLERGYKPMASTAMLTGRTWTAHRKGDFVEYFEEVTFTDSTRIYRYKSIRPDTIINVCETTRYYLSLIENPGRFDEGKVGKQTKGDYIIEECTYEGRKTFRSEKILLTSPTRLEIQPAYRSYTTMAGSGKQTYVREE